MFVARVSRSVPRFFSLRDSRFSWPPRIALPPAALAEPVPTADPLEAVLGKVFRRLIPFLFLLYVVNILDRVNVGFARLQMLDDLGLSESVYGLGAGIFYVGYMLFEVPSNLILHRMARAAGSAAS